MLSCSEIVFKWLTKANHLKQQIQSDVNVNDADEDEVEFLTSAKHTEEDQDNYGDNEEDNHNKRSTTTPTENEKKMSRNNVKSSIIRPYYYQLYQQQELQKLHREDTPFDLDNNDNSEEHLYSYPKKSRLQLICNKICAILLSNQSIKPYEESITTSMVKVLSAYLIRNDRNHINEKSLAFSSPSSNSNSTNTPLYKRVDISLRKDIVFLTRQQFQQMLQVALALFEYSKPSRKDDLNIACQIRERKRPLIVLFGGTSGCGKSTLASLLASRLGITKVLSTDSVRHMLRGFISKETNPVLFASTYHAGECIRGNPKYAHLTEDELVIEGYRQQCRIVIDQLEKIIDNCQKHNEPLVVEGVHLLTDFMVELMKKYPDCIVPYVIYISNDQKHKERFAFRAKYMTLEPRNNKYVQYFEHIRQIQSYICSRADYYDVPKIDNSNIDRSLATIHASVFKSIKKVVLSNESLYDLNLNKANISRTYTKPIWNSSRMLKAIRKKRTSLELNVSTTTPIANIRQRLSLQQETKTDEESDTDSDESTRTDDGANQASNVNSGAEVPVQFPVQFSPKLTRFERNHKRLIRSRKKMQLTSPVDDTFGIEPEISSESDQDLLRQHQLSSDTDGAVGSLSEFSDSISDVRHMDFFDAS